MHEFTHEHSCTETLLFCIITTNTSHYLQNTDHHTQQGVPAPYKLCCTCAIRHSSNTIAPVRHLSYITASASWSLFLNAGLSIFKQHKFELPPVTLQESRHNITTSRVSSVTLWAVKLLTWGHLAWCIFAILNPQETRKVFLLKPVCQRCIAAFSQLQRSCS